MARRDFHCDTFAEIKISGDIFVTFYFDENENGWNEAAVNEKSGKSCGFDRTFDRECKSILFLRGFALLFPCGERNRTTVGPKG